MRVILCDTNAELKRVLPLAREHLNMAVDGFVGSITDMAVAAMVAQSDGFGLAAGSLTDAYRKRFAGVDRGVKDAIAGFPFGELLVGQAVAVPLDNTMTKHLVVASISRGVQPIGNASAVMIAARAAMDAALKVKAESIAFPCIGAGFGELPYETVVLGVLAGIAAAQGHPASFPDHHPFFTPGA